MHQLFRRYAKQSWTGLRRHHIVLLLRTARSSNALHIAAVLLTALARCCDGDGFLNHLLCRPRHIGIYFVGSFHCQIASCNMHG